VVSTHRSTKEPSVRHICMVEFPPVTQATSFRLSPLDTDWTRTGRKHPKSPECVQTAGRPKGPVSTKETEPSESLIKARS